MMQGLDHLVDHWAEVLTASIENPGYPTHYFSLQFYLPKRADASYLASVATLLYRRCTPPNAREYTYNHVRARKTLGY
jgi:hypothetical protein